MAWVKKGLIYAPEGKYEWDNNTILTPTPYLLNENVIRIYGGFRDVKGQSRIGYIDTDANNPANVIKVSKTPVIPLGQDGMFDDSGMILGDIVATNDGTIRMYYVGFQIPTKAKFMAYSGLAISCDGGETFKRYKQTPIMDRTENALYIRAIHTVMQDEGKWKIWYSVGCGWEIIKGKPYPQYNIRYVESDDGLTINDNQGILCVPVNENEYRIGRPRVTKNADGSYVMRYTSDTYNKKYSAGYAISDDGIHWVRQDEKIGITPSETGWDSEMLCYPVEIKYKDKKYLFYSGNAMGMTGVGYAEWEYQ